jgi:hypothetical protein
VSRFYDLPVLSLTGLPGAALADELHKLGRAAQAAGLEHHRRLVRLGAGLTQADEQLGIGSANGLAQFARVHHNTVKHALKIYGLYGNPDGTIDDERYEAWRAADAKRRDEGVERGRRHADGTPSVAAVLRAADAAERPAEGKPGAPKSLLERLDAEWSVGWGGGLIKFEEASAEEIERWNGSNLAREDALAPVLAKIGPAGDRGASGAQMTFIELLEEKWRHAVKRVNAFIDGAALDGGDPVAAQEMVELIERLDERAGELMASA